MDLYIKGKYENGVGTAAFLAVNGNKIEAMASSRLGASFKLGYGMYACDQFSTELVAAICGIARCGEEKEIRVFSNNKTVVKWLDRGDEPESRNPLVNQWRLRKNGKKVSVEWMPRYDRDPTGNPWNRMCNIMATNELCG